MHAVLVDHLSAAKFITYRLIDLAEAIIYFQLLGFVQGLAVVFDPCKLLTSVLDRVVDQERRGAAAALL